MLFRRDVEEPGSWWADEGLDDKVTHFEPCELCDATMAVRETNDRVWQEFALCHECDGRLQIEGAIAAARDERPVNLDRELETIVDRDKLQGLL